MKNTYVISGIQQIGIGVENYAEAWKHYIDLFGMDVKILEDNTVAQRMLRYTGNQPQRRRAGIVINMQGGGGMEIWQYTDRQPQKIGFDIAFGDLGVLVCKIKSCDVAKSYQEMLHKKGVKLLGPLIQGLDGWQTFYLKDIYDNLFQIVHDTSIFYDEQHSIGGPVGAIIGTTDIDKALRIYRDILGYDTIINDQTGHFDDIASLQGGTGLFRRVLLTHAKQREGGFSRLFGQSYIELVQALDRQPRKLYEGRYWGDPGFIQICFDIRNMNALKKECAEMGSPFTIDSAEATLDTDTFDMGEAAGRFAYIEDHDGTLIEFVETHKIPIVKKLGLNLNLKKRDPRKPISDILLKMLRFRRVKPEDIKG